MQKVTKLNQLEKGNEYLLEYYSVSMRDVLNGKPKGRHRFKVTTSKDGSFWEFTKEYIFSQIYLN